MNRPLASVLLAVAVLVSACSPAKGDPGEKGAKGDTGATGPAGADGLTGPTGPQGPPGTAGTAGTQGAQGIQGLQGIQGPAGVFVPAAATRTCLTIKVANAAATSGNYTLVAAGKAFAATCDMTNMGGGWTLIQSHILGQPSQEGPTVLGGSGRWLQADLVQSLALASSLVLIRRTSGTPLVNYALSADAYPIGRLRQLKILTDDSQPLTNAVHWTTAGTVGPANMNYLAGGDTNANGGTYPSIYWATGNGGGLHVLPDMVAALATHGFVNDSDGLDVWVK